MAPPPGAGALEKARTAAQKVARRFGVREATDRDLREWRRDPGRTLYVFDVRTPEEYLAGHLAEAAAAPGGQLVQSTDAYAAVRNARIVLVDADGVRAPMTASWLVQMGWRDVYVWRDAMAGAALVEGPSPQEILGLGEARTIAPRELRDLLDGGKVEVVDLASSLEYRRGHIPGAAYAIRSRLAQSLPKLASGRPLLLTSPDGVLARLAAPEAAALRQGPVSVLDGGTAAWTAAGFPLEPGTTRMLDDADDVYYLPYDHPDRVEQAMRDYLTWEVALVDQLAREGVRFPAFPGSA
jgi:rhodanese-related sulfurtransferase